ncbi:MAG: GNAT family N-acetyltransferase [Chlorobi bacterium]|nr:GNAT family N-acetyltransferase [Chlorobiota bacterium]
MEKLIVDRIEDLTRFEEIKNDWEQLYGSDPNSNVYISWNWMYGCFSFPSSEWMVLGVKDTDTSCYVAFLPLTFYYHGAYGIYPIRQIVYGGKPLSVYSGFLCSPDFEFEAIRKLAYYVQSNLKWDIFHFKWIKDPRIGIFMHTFQHFKYLVRESKSLTALIITLPDDYETYLYNYLSKRTRHTIKVRTKYILENKNFILRYANAETIDKDLDALCDLWLKRWGQKHQMEWYKHIFRHLFENNLLRLSVIYDGDVPVSAVACSIDPVNRFYNAIITSYNRDYSKIAPGFVLFAESIKQAIEQNYKYYDFTVGLDLYKRAFGPELYETKNVSITRKNIKTFVAIKIAKNVKRILKKLLKKKNKQ